MRPGRSRFGLSGQTSCLKGGNTITRGKAGDAPGLLAKHGVTALKGQNMSWHRLWDKSCVTNTCAPLRWFLPTSSLGAAAAL